MFTTKEGLEVYFPSQIAELINGLIIFIILFILAYKKTNRGKIYPWYLVIYGGTRFILNFFRKETAPFFIGLSAGSFWALCAVIIGSIIFWVMQKRYKRNIFNTKKKELWRQEK